MGRCGSQAAGGPHWGLGPVWLTLLTGRADLTPRWTSFFHSSLCVLLLLLQVRALPRGPRWWLSDKEYICQCRGPAFNPWSGKTPHAAGRLSPCATPARLCSRVREPQLLKPAHPETELCSKRSHYGEKPAHCNWRAVPAPRN